MSVYQSCRKKQRQPLTRAVWWKSAGLAWTSQPLFQLWYSNPAHCARPRAMHICSQCCIPLLGRTIPSPLLPDAVRQQPCGRSSENIGVGAPVGANVGTRVVGNGDGAAVDGEFVGAADGGVLGAFVGICVGRLVGGCVSGGVNVNAHVTVHAKRLSHPAPLSIRYNCTVYPVPEIPDIKHQYLVERHPCIDTNPQV